MPVTHIATGPFRAVSATASLTHVTGEDVADIRETAVAQTRRSQDNQVIETMTRQINKLPHSRYSWSMFVTPLLDPDTGVGVCKLSDPLWPRAFSR